MPHLFKLSAVTHIHSANMSSASQSSSPYLSSPSYLSTLSLDDPSIGSQAEYPGNHLCRQCNQRFSTSSQYSRHRRRHHQPTVQVSYINSGKCPLFTFSTPCLRIWPSPISELTTPIVNRWRHHSQSQWGWPFSLPLQQLQVILAVCLPTTRQKLHWWTPSTTACPATTYR